MELVEDGVVMRQQPLMSIEISHVEVARVHGSLGRRLTRLKAVAGSAIFVLLTAVTLLHVDRRVYVAASAE